MNQSYLGEYKATPVSASPNTSKPPNRIDINIVNGTLCFINSQLQRLDQDSVIKSISKNFSLEEIKAARELLFKSTGTKAYNYRPPNEPCTLSDKSSHCVASIIHKIKDLDNGESKYRVFFF